MNRISYTAYDWLWPGDIRSLALAFKEYFGLGARRVKSYTLFKPVFICLKLWYQLCLFFHKSENNKNKNYSDVIWASRCLKSTRLLVQQPVQADKRENSKAKRFLPLVQWLPSQKANNTKSVSMSWRHNESLHHDDVGPRCTPCWRHEPCYQGNYIS